MDNLLRFFKQLRPTKMATIMTLLTCTGLLVVGYWLLKGPPTLESSAKTSAADGTIGSARISERSARFALVIGNGNYQNAPHLSNPVRDAVALGNALQRLGFVVIVGTELDREGMRAKIKEFRNAAKDADIALAFYAGHGLQVSGQNWLLPVDVNLESVEDLVDEAFQADRLLDEMNAVKTLRVLILDACRDNPFRQTITRTAGLRAITVGRGLAQLEPVGNGNTLVAYATRADDVAYDGSGADSPFTEALIQHIDKPLEIRQLFGLVRDTVLAATQRKQEPYIYQSIGQEEIYLASQSDDKAIVSAKLAAPIVAPEFRPNESRAIEQVEMLASAPADPEIVFWESIKDSSSVAEYRAYVQHYPEGKFLALARVRINMLENSININKMPRRRKPEVLPVARHRPSHLTRPSRVIAYRQPLPTEEQIEAEQERREQAEKLARQRREERQELREKAEDERKELAEKAEEERKERMEERRERAEKARKEAAERMEEEQERLEEEREKRGG